MTSDQDQLSVLVTALEEAADRICAARLDTLTVEQLATSWHCTPATVRRWIKAGELQASCLGGLYRVAVGEARRFFEFRRVKR